MPSGPLAWMANLVKSCLVLSHQRYNRTYQHCFVAYHCILLNVQVNVRQHLMVRRKNRVMFKRRQTNTSFDVSRRVVNLKGDLYEHTLQDRPEVCLVS